MDRALVTRVGVGLLAGLGILGQACGDSATGGAGGTGTSADQSSSASKSTSTKASTTAGPTVVASSSGGPVDLLGAACETDAECGAAYTCLKSSDNWPALTGGGPPLGYCTKTCVTSPDCGDGNLCLGNGTNAHCAAGCVIGEPPMQFLLEELDPTKCHGRHETACFQRGADSFCRPVCQSDSECGGRVCNKRTGLCDAAGTTGLPLGSACDPNGTDCEGICVSFTDDGGSFCSSYCTYGGDNTPEECGGSAAGLCFFSPTGHELGDSAFCTAGCKAHDECQNPLFWCFSIEGVEENGYCIGTVDCPNGQPDCAANAGTTCTPTSYGPKCIDNTFPLTGEGGGSSSSSSASASVSASISASVSVSASASGSGGAGGN